MCLLFPKLELKKGEKHLLGEADVGKNFQRLSNHTFPALH